MNSLEDLQATVDGVMATNIVQQSEIEALLFLCRRLADRAGITELDGLSLVDWFQREKRVHLQTVLLQLEDKNPATAAFLQSIIDDSDERTGQEPPDVT